MAEDDSKKDNVGAEWNFDLAELNILFDDKVNSKNTLNGWNLEECFWNVRSFYREIDAKLNEEERKTRDSTMNNLTESRNKHNDKKITDEEYFMELEKVYVEICRLCQLHGLYFRTKSFDYGGL